MGGCGTWYITRGTRGVRGVRGSGRTVVVVVLVVVLTVLHVVQYTCGTYTKCHEENNATKNNKHEKIRLVKINLYTFTFTTRP